MSTYAEACEALDEGYAVARSGWNGKGMFLYKVNVGNYPAKSDVAKAHWGEDALVPYGAYTAIKASDGIVYPWTPSQQDQYATDWEIVPFGK